MCIIFCCRNVHHLCVWCVAPLRVTTICSTIMWAAEFFRERQVANMR
jgi:hypothetical protein